jgi:hypothetical protein
VHGTTPVDLLKIKIDHLDSCIMAADEIKSDILKQDKTIRTANVRADQAT